MKASTVALLICCPLLAVCAYTHRRVIRSLVTGEPMPKAPNWHCWVPAEQRRNAKEA